jgi:hypothetical protein
LYATVGVFWWSPISTKIILSNDEHLVRGLVKKVKSRHPKLSDEDIAFCVVQSFKVEQSIAAVVWPIDFFATLLWDPRQLSSTIATNAFRIPQLEVLRIVNSQREESNKK